MVSVRSWARKVWLSRWTPALFVLAALSGWMLYKKAPPRPTFQLDGDILVSGNPNLHEVCLTFDDGPHPGSMDDILRVLKEEDVRATFFVVGKVVDQHPYLVRQMMSDGHEVGNHTYSHKRLIEMPIESARQEIAACAASVKRATGSNMTLLRPPGMKYNNAILNLAQDMGYVTIHWNVVAADYVPVEPGLVYNRVINQTRDGSVILLHDSPDTAKALRSIIKELKLRKYRFVTASQMLARLPRPVTVATNAFSVVPKPPVVVPTLQKAAPKKKPVPTKLAAPPVKTPAATKSPRQVTDVPAWDGVSGSAGREPEITRSNENAVG